MSRNLEDPRRRATRPFHLNRADQRQDLMAASDADHFRHCAAPRLASTFVFSQYISQSAQKQYTPRQMRCPMQLQRHVQLLRPICRSYASQARKRPSRLESAISLDHVCLPPPASTLIATPPHRYTSVQLFGSVWLTLQYQTVPPT